jgi:signal peptidase I
MRLTRPGKTLLWLAAVLSIGGTVTARLAGIRPVQIVSGSMTPTVERGDWIVVRAGHDGIRRGDIVLFSFPLGTSGRAIKRVVALAGDHVTILPRAVVVNRHRIAIDGAPTAYAAGPRSQIVPAGDVFLLGDNSKVSIDSRSFGPVPAREVVAREILVAGGTTTIALIGVGVVILLGALAAVTTLLSGRRAPRALHPSREASVKREPHLSADRRPAGHCTWHLSRRPYDPHNTRRKAHECH